ncbi:MAG: hypothetical protein E6767_19260 [Dysgonomonas sp.]|nr:hypothetical protein [Dysgonomonas sp.]
MKKISFAEKNTLVVKHKSKKFFFKDLELFSKHCPSHALNNELAMANEFSYDRLDGQMLYELLSTIPIEVILQNRKEEATELPEPPKVKTVDDVKVFLISEFSFTDQDFDVIGEDYLQFLTSKEDVDIKIAIEKFTALRPTIIDDEDEDDGDENGENNEEGTQGPEDLDQGDGNAENLEQPEGEQVGEKPSDLGPPTIVAITPSESVNNESIEKEVVDPKKESAPAGESSNKKKGTKAKNSPK